jgi:hypothetical protein
VDVDENGALIGRKVMYSRVGHRWRLITMRVNRPDAIVRTGQGYDAPKK